MGIIAINSLNDGINAKADPSAISDGSMHDCYGWDLTQEGVLKTAGGLAANDISMYLPTGNLQCARILYIGSARYILATTSTGLYSNGTLVQSGFTERFSAVSYLNNIFLVNGVQAIRFDGTACYQWGITAPTAIPTIAVGTYLYKDVDTFESLTTWIANAVSCTVAAEGTIKKEGTYSAKFTVTTSTRGYSYVTKTLDLTKFSGGQASTDKDYFRFWLYVDNLVNLDEVALFVDVGDGTFINDYFSYSIVSPGLNATIQALGLGKTADVSSEETTTVPAGTTLYKSVQTPIGDTTQAGYATIQEPYTTEQDTTVINRITTKTVIDPVVTDQVLSFWRRSSLIQLKSATWIEVKVPKSMFIQSGDTTKDWSTISAIKIEVASTSQGTVNVYIDGMKILGGSDLVGDYWFTYSWCRMDSSGNVLHESAPSRNNTTKLVNIIGPVTFDRQPLVYSSRPLSSDPQVNGAILGVLGNTLPNFWVLTQINDNTTVTDTLYGVGDSTAQRYLCSQHNEPAPPGTDLVVHQNKIWMVGDSSYPRYLRSSDILSDGTFAPEAWPTRNAYDLENNKGNLTNIRIVNGFPVVKGTSGEWYLQVLDPTDFLQVKSKKVSHYGLMGQDAVVSFETSNIYPSPGGFVESTGQQASLVLPEIQPIIDDGMINAKAIAAGITNYFTYQSNLTGTRTAKIDLFRGKPRFCNINNILLDWLFIDEITNKVYTIENGVVYSLDSGSTNQSTSSKELASLIRSKAYRPGGSIAWNRIEIIHNTGGVWFILEVYIDGVLRASMPFMSTNRTVQSFRDFGPCSGYEFQFVITGSYSAPGTIYFPIRIYHGGQ